jgi:hypothetical protein
MADRDFWVQQTVSPLGSDTHEAGEPFPCDIDAAIGFV